MKIALLSTVIAAAATIGAGAPGDVLLEAMNDELSRSIKELRIEKYDRPYFISYFAKDFDMVHIEAKFGAITADWAGRHRTMAVDVHVGDYKLDSGNMGNGSDSAGTLGGIDGVFGHSLSVDSDYDAIRHKLWLSTDAEYKQAVRRLERKRSELQQRNVKERPDDWSKEPPLVLVQPKPDFHPDRAEWARTASRLSGIFKKYPRIRESGVTFRAGLVTRYLVNTEGSKSRVFDQDCSLMATAVAQAPDGKTISDKVEFIALNDREMPQVAAMERGIDEFAQRLSKVVDAKDAESYEGPVLFVGESAATFFFFALTPHVVVQRPLDDFPVAFEGMPTRVGRRILPQFLHVVDDPQLKDAAGAFVPGSFEVDDQGVAAQRVVLVEKGILKTLLSSRLPTPKVKNSNGHALNNSGACFSNLIVQSDVQCSPDSLKAKLLELGKSEGLDYVLVVRKFDNEGPPPTPYSRMDSGFHADTERVSLPLAVQISRAYVSDGHEELIRGGNFADLSVRVLRDIVASGNDSQAYRQTIYDRSTSITTPSIIVTNMELHKGTNENFKAPVIVHPYFEKE